MWETSHNEMIKDNTGLKIIYLSGDSPSFQIDK